MNGLEFVFSDPDLFLSVLVVSTFKIAYNVLVYLSASRHPAEILYTKWLKVASIINLILIGFFILIPRIMGWMGIIINLLLIPPFIFTYGLTFLYYGKENQDMFKKYLKRTGIYFTISYLLALFFVFDPLMKGLATMNLFITILYWSIGLTIIALKVLAYCFMIKHANLHEDSYLKFSAILSIVLIALSFVLNPLIITNIYAFI